MKSTITYRIFYWVPNTLSGERVAIGLCLFDKENDRFNIYWISQRELTRLQNIFVFSSKEDSRDILNLLGGLKNSLKSQAFDSRFWSYLESYWNGIIQISDANKLLYQGTKEGFEEKSEVIRKKLLPLVDIKRKRSPGRHKTLVTYFEKEVKKKKLQDKVSLGTEIPEHGKYRLLQSIYFDLAARNHQLVGSAGFDMALKTNTLTKKAYAYFEGVQNIKNVEGSGNFSFVLHERGKKFNLGKKSDVGFYDDFRYRCKDLDIEVIQLDELPDFVNNLSELEDLRPLESVQN